jgi:hypothetical protein
MILSSMSTAAKKACYLRLCLEVKLPAEKWFQVLNQAVRTDWDQLKPAFT